MLTQGQWCAILWLPIGIICGAECECKYTYGFLLLVWTYGKNCWLCGLNWLPNSMPFNLFWTTWIFHSYSCGWYSNVLATFCNSTCSTIHVLMWKGTKGQSMIACPFSHNAQTLESSITISESTYSWSHVLTSTLFNPTLDSLYMSMIMALHPTHSLVPLHTQMIVGNFLQFPQPHRYWCFLPPPSIPLVHSNLEMQINTQT